jgi:hypothetical protein
MPLSWRLQPRVVLAVVVGVAILALGAFNVFQRGERWESTASVTLVPDPEVPAERTILLEAFDRSGTLGTYVELLSSRSVEAAAGIPPDSADVRAIPDTRVIDVTVSGERGEVGADVAKLVELATARAGNLGDLWTMEVLQEPSKPTRAGLPTALLVGLTGFLALLGAVATFAAASLLPRRLAGASRPPRESAGSNGSGSPEPDRLAAAREQTFRWP